MVTRIEYQREMDKLHQSIIRMGATVEKAIDDAIRALDRLDLDLARRIIDGDDVIDAMERSIDRHCVEIIARQQPVASDLRDVTSALKLITDLERIADHASDICERILDISQYPQRVEVPVGIFDIIGLASNMLRGALDAYVIRDEAQAVQIISMDTRVAELYEQIKRDLVARMKTEPASIGPLVEMLLISKYVERIADHAQNVAEWVVFYIKGRYAKE